MADYEIKEPREFREEVRKFEPTDRAHADVFNAVVEVLINNDAFLKRRMDNLDFGEFTNEVKVEVHNGTAYAHGNMIADGGSVEVCGDVIITTLGEHLVDQYAHQNIILDGNS